MDDVPFVFVALPQSQRTDTTTSPRTRLRRNIRALMGANGVTQTRLAAEIGMSQQLLSNRLRGITPFDEDDIARIADYFRREPADLLGTSTIWYTDPGRQRHLAAVPHPKTPRLASPRTPLVRTV